ncbi:MAG: D-alanine--D-alanine ligase family protein, partial [Wenzhouxiangellaceae bacterium]
MSLPDRIAVLTGDPSLPDPTKQHQRYGPEDLAVHAAMKEAFATIPGIEVHVLEEHAKMFEELDRLRPDLVVNFCDTGLFNRPDQEIHVVTALDQLGLPYTGAPPRAMLICFDKQIVRLVAESLGVPVPRERFLPAGSVRDASLDEFPVLIKPNAADGSVGITKNAVAKNATEAREYLGWLATELPDRDVLVQEYLPGPEFGLGLLGNPGMAGGLQGLPMLEVDFSALPEGLAPILSFESKADPDSPYWTDIRFRPASLPTEDQAALAANCQTLFARLGLRDYGRFDFRTAADGTVRLMEVNPNPAWGFDAKLAIMAGLADWS